MKLIKYAAAALISLSSLAAQAGYLSIVGGDSNAAITNNNAFKSSLTATKFNIGGNVETNFSGSATIKFTYLGVEAAYENKFKAGTGSFQNAPGKPYGTAVGSSFSMTDSFSMGDLLDFYYQKGGTSLKVVNGANTPGDMTLSFATLLDSTFDGTLYDAILFFDDTGGPQDDDNHDDLVVGVKILSVPESSTLVLTLMGLFGLFAARRMKA